MDITVVIPVDGRWSYLGRSLETLLRQRALLKDIAADIIVVDNARSSEDRARTRETCVALSLRHPTAQAQLRYIATCHRNPGHRNVGYPRNVGIRLAEAPVVLTADADILHVTETIGQHLARHREFENRIVYSFCRDCPPDVQLSTHTLLAASQDAAFALRMAACTDWFGGMCCSARRESLLAIGGFEESFSCWGYEDYDLARRLCRRGTQVLRDDDIKVLHQVHPPQTRGAWRMKVRAGLRQVLRIMHANRGRTWGEVRGTAEVLKALPEVSVVRASGLAPSERLAATIGTTDSFIPEGEAAAAQHRPATAQESLHLTGR